MYGDKMKALLYIAFLFKLLQFCFGYTIVNYLPPLRPRNHAMVARTLVHKANWTSIGSISSHPSLKGFPMITLISISDSAIGEPSTGRIFFMLTDLDYTGKDWNAHNNETIMISNDQDLSCQKRGIDPMEPTCSRVIITGSIIKFKDTDPDYEFAKHSFISRHPAGKSWFCVHDFYLAEFNISTILVIDWYGGAHNVTREDYFNNNPIEIYLKN